MPTTHSALESFNLLKIKPASCKKRRTLFVMRRPLYPSRSKYPIFEVSGSNNRSLNGPESSNNGYLDPLGFLFNAKLWVLGPSGSPRSPASSRGAALGPAGRPEALTGAGDLHLRVPKVGSDPSVGYLGFLCTLMIYIYIYVCIYIYIYRGYLEFLCTWGLRNESGSLRLLGSPCLGHYSSCLGPQAGTEVWAPAL